MRVLVVSAWPPEPLTDGGRLVLAHQLRHLAGRHDVTLVSPEPAAGPAAYLRRRAAGLARLEPADAVAVETPAVVAAVRAGGVDLVHLHGWGTAGLHRHAPPGVPVVHHAVDVWSGALRLHRALPAWRRAAEATEPLLVRRHERRHYPRLCAVAVVTEAEAEALRPWAPVVVVPNGVELGPEPAGPADEPVLGLHGVLTTVSNAATHRRLVERVLPLVRRSRPDARVHAVGPGTATGEVVDLRAELASMAVYVAPVERAAGVKNKILEAMAAGLPVVTTPAGASGIGAGPGIRVAGSDAALAGEVVALLDDPVLRRAEGAAARDRVRDRTWAASAAALEAVWEACVSRAGPRPGPRRSPRRSRPGG